MARFVDLGDSDDDQGAAESLAQQHLHPGVNGIGFNGHGLPVHNGSDKDQGSQPPPEHPPRIQNLTTMAFACYPVVAAIVSHIDLNTLDSLARTSFFIHASLIQYRQVLINSTLHCSNEAVPVDHDQVFRYRARASNWEYMQEDGRNYEAKSGDCARDLVEPCRRCSKVICRNCAIKPPAPVTLRERHRRLCSPCTRAPIATLAKPPLDPSLPLDAEAVQRALCQCDKQGVWLCQPCGGSIRGADNEYHRIWRWRSQYGEILGGLGTGIGEGDRGVICGREADCCAAKEREQEIDCDAQDAKDNGHLGSWADVQSASSGSTPSPSGSQHSLNPLDLVLEDYRQERTPSPQLRTGYERHEIEGIGGVVKRKLVRMVRVGACVPDYEDEIGPGKKALVREVRGERRSWCGWCWRAIPSEKDSLSPSIGSPSI
ncbi:unnamed protein product, partial [Clonostachys rosea]